MSRQPKIFSPMASGNGAYIIHSMLAKHIKNYTLKSIPAKKTVVPFLLSPYRQAADIIHTVPEYSNALCTNSSKLVLTFHNYFWDKHYRQYCSFSQKVFYRFLQQYYVQKAVKHADAIVAVSEYTAKLVRHAFPKREVKVILNGIDTKHFSPSNQKKDKPATILFSGNPTRRKGRFVLDKIARQLPDNASLMITGGLRNLNKTLDHPQVQDIGYIPYSEMAQLYQQADLLLLPSYREGLSLSTLEAMSSGLPIVCYDTSSMSELVINGHGGLLCQADDIEQLIQNIRVLVNDPEQRKAMGHFNRRRCEELFTEKRMVAEYVQLFETL